MEDENESLDSQFIGPAIRPQRAHNETTFFYLSFAWARAVQ